MHARSLSLSAAGNVSPRREREREVFAGCATSSLLRARIVWVKSQFAHKGGELWKEWALHYGAAAPVVWNWWRVHTVNLPLEEFSANIPLMTGLNILAEKLQHSWSCLQKIRRLVKNECVRWLWRGIIYTFTCSFLNLSAGYFTQNFFMVSLQA
jgi:hypothetical protein